MKGPCLFGSVSLHFGCLPPTRKVLWSVEVPGSERAALQGEGDRGEEGSLHMTRLPGGQLLVFRGGPTAGCMEPRTVGAHPEELALHTKVP